MLLKHACRKTSRQNGQNIECFEDSNVLLKLSRRSLLSPPCRDEISAHNRLPPALRVTATELFSFQPSFPYLSLFTSLIPLHCLFLSLDRSTQYASPHPAFEMILAHEANLAHLYHADCHPDPPLSILSEKQPDLRQQAYLHYLISCTGADMRLTSPFNLPTSPSHLSTSPLLASISFNARSYISCALSKSLLAPSPDVPPIFVLTSSNHARAMIKRFRASEWAWWVVTWVL